MNSWKGDEKIGIAYSNNIEVQLELGSMWTINKIEALLRDAPTDNLNDRLLFIAQRFIGTPLVFESNLPILKNGRLRINLESFDCITFIYYIIALSKASNFDDFVRNIWLLRYNVTNEETVVINNDPDNGNIFNFAYESILENAVKRSFLRNVTEEVAGSVPLELISVEIKRFQRPIAFDKQVQFVSPKLGDRFVSGSFIPTSRLGEINKDRLRSGDIVLLTRGERGRDGKRLPVLIGHLAITVKEDQSLYFIHATRHFSWRPDATVDSPSEYTGIFYDNERKKEQIGIGYGGEFAGDEYNCTFDHTTYCGMNQNRRRTLDDYAGSNFYGAIFMRPEG